jgi:hypothetical protein
LHQNILNNQAEAESAFNEFVGSRTLEFYQTGIMKRVSRWQKCVDCNGFYLDQYILFRANFHSYLRLKTEIYFATAEDYKYY